MLARHPDGLLLGLVGVNHAKFSCGVPARTARLLKTPGGGSSLDAVASILLNPTPFTTFDGPSELRICEGMPPVANEACLRNDIELQNYVLQIPFAAGVDLDEARRAAALDAAASAMQAKSGSSVLALSDYVMFSPE